MCTTVEHARGASSITLALALLLHELHDRQADPSRARASERPMEQRKAGDSSLTLSTLGFGCWQFGSAGEQDYWGLDFTDELALALTKQATAAGIVYFDTAEDYAKGGSEEQLGRRLKQLDAATRAKVNIGRYCPTTRFGGGAHGNGVVFRSSLRADIHAELGRAHARPPRAHATRARDIAKSEALRPCPPSPWTTSCSP